MDGLELNRVVEKIGQMSNYELGLVIKDDIVTSDSFGLSLVQARFLLEVAERLEGCKCWDRDKEVPVEAVDLVG